MKSNLSNFRFMLPTETSPIHSGAVKTMKSFLSKLSMLVCATGFVLQGLSHAQAEEPFELSSDSVFRGNMSHVHQPGNWGHYPTTYERLPEDKGWFYETDFDRMVQQAASQVWLKLEYLNWNIDDPGNVVIGNSSDIPNGDPETPYDVTDRNVGGLFTGFVSTLDRIGLEANDGMRGTIGLPTAVGDFEASIWFLAEHSQDYRRPLPDVNPTQDEVWIIPTLFNGAARGNNTVLVFDQGFDINYQTQITGTEINFNMKSKKGGLGLHFRPSIGSYYITVEEDLFISGMTGARTARVTSNAKNDLFGGQFGLLTEFRHQWFTLSAKPTVMIGFNRQKAQVITSELHDTAMPGLDSLFGSRDSHNRFAPNLKLELKAMLHIHHNFSLFAGYDLLYMTNVTRPGENIFWDDSGVGTDGNRNNNATHVNLDHVDMLIQGLSVGGELTF